LVQEKLVALQREVDIEIKIQEGLEKITKAKPKKKAKKSTAPDDMDLQLIRNYKRLEILKHEIQKRNKQLQILQAADVGKSPQGLNGQAGKGASGSLNVSSAQGVNILKNSNSEIQDTGVLHVIVTDPITNSEFKKAVYIGENRSTIEVIETILNKSNIPGIPSNFQLLYKVPETGIIVFLKDEDRPMQVEDIDFAETLFILDVI
jgi:hypothetical protein